MAGSTLLPLALRGVGTADVESLPSYLCRLSAAHSVSVRDVIEHAFLWFGKEREIRMPFVARSPESLAYYVRPNGMTDLLVQALQCATQRSNLGSATFLALAPAVDRCMNTFHPSVRWCPVCIREFVELGDDGYVKLQWHLADIATCPAHGVGLIDRCPHCARHQNGSAQRRCSTHCVHCSRPLTTEEFSVAPPGRWRIEAADLLDLVTHIGCDPNLRFPAHGPRTLLTEAVNRATRDQEELKLWSTVPRKEVLSFVEDKSALSLRTARRLAYHLGISLVEMLSGVLANTTEALDVTWNSRTPSCMRPNRRPVRRNRARLLVVLQDAVGRARTGAPESLRHIAKTSGVSSGCLSYHFPALSQELLLLHKKWKKFERNRKRVDARAAVFAYISSARPDRQFSKKGILRVLREETKLPKEILRKEIAECTKGCVT